MTNRPVFPALTADALLALARTGGPGAALAARRAAMLSEALRPALAREALLLAIRLEPGDSETALALARVHAEGGDIEAARQAAAKVSEEAVDLGARARAEFILGEIARLTGAPGQARIHFKQALLIEQRLLASDRADPVANRWYARARGRLAELDAADGDLQRARSGAEGALALLRACAAQIGEPPVLAADIADAEMRLAGQELDRGEAASARRRLGEAIGRYEALAVTEKSEPHWRARLADAWTLAAEAELVRGLASEARAAIDKALQARLRLASQHKEEAPALAGTWRVRAALLTQLGDNAGAADALAQAAALSAGFHQREPQNEAAARFHFNTLMEQIDLALNGDALAIAVEAADAARALCEPFASSAAPGWSARTAAAWDRLAEAARRAGQSAQAHEAGARAVEFRRRECALSADAQAERGLAAALLRAGEFALASGAIAAARAAFEESAGLRTRFMTNGADPANGARALAAALDGCGRAAQAQGDTGGARRAWERTLTLADAIFARADADAEALRYRAIAHARLSGLGGASAHEHRRHALALMASLNEVGALTDQDRALQRKLQA